MTAPIRETAEEPWLWCDIRGSFAVRHRYFCHQSLNAVFDTIVASSSCDWLCNPLHSAPLRASLSSPANKVLISLISLAQKCDACTKQKIYWASGAVSAICRVYPVLVLLRQTLEFWLSKKLELFLKAISLASCESQLSNCLWDDVTPGIQQSPAPPPGYWEWRQQRASICSPVNHQRGMMADRKSTRLN